MPIDLELVLGYSRDLQRAGTLQDLVVATRKAVTHATRYRTMWIAAFERGAEGEWVRILAATGSDERIIWEETPRFPVGNDAMLLEIRDGRRPVVVEDARTDPRTDKEIIARAGHRTTINIPLLLGEVAIGALGVATFADEGVMPPTPSELEHLTVFATQLAAAFDRVRLLEQKRAADAQAERLEAERTRLEAQLRQAQKLEAVGTLAGGIAHDFNNILAAILAHGELTLQSMDVTDPNWESLDIIVSSAKRAAHLTRNLLAFSRKQIVTLRPTLVQDVLRSVAALLRPVLREDIELTLSLPPEDLVVAAGEGELEQVVVNLVNNARDAMPRGGTLAVTASAITIDDAFVMAHGSGLLGRCVRIAVSDTGQGMDAATRARIFEPFFTTKERGRGTGLGLATARSIVEQHHGLLLVDSAPGKGSTFSIYLPTTDVAAMRSAEAAGVHGRSGTETILVAEDEDVVRRLVRRVLEGHGYRVIEASDGQEAIEKFRAESATIDLVLTDIVMPRRSGLDLYEAVRAFRQDTVVILTSGYAADAFDQQRVTEEQIQVLPKPVRPTLLLETIRRALDERRVHPAVAARPVKNTA